MKLEGVGADDAEMFMPVLLRVLKTFEGAERVDLRGRSADD